MILQLYLVNIIYLLFLKISVCFFGHLKVQNIEINEKRVGPC